MKRYTGQQALYEAISRSQAKAKRGSMLEKLRPQPPKQEKPAPEEPKPGIEAVPAPAEAPQPVSKEPAKFGKAVTKESTKPAAKETVKPFAKDTAKSALKETAKSTMKERPLQTRVKDDPPKPLAKGLVPEPREKPEPPVIGPRPFEKIGRLKPAQPLLRPKAVQLNGRRVEVSVPYYVGVAAGLVVILMMLGAFRVGQGHPSGQARVAAPAKLPVRATPQNAVPTVINRPQPETPAVAPRVTEPVPAQEPPQTQGAPQGQGDHLLVLARSRRQADLDPVIRYFADNGVELMALPLTDATRKSFTEKGYNAAALGSGDGFLLIAGRFYNNPEREGTDGHAMKQKIIDLGQKYRAQPGSQMFGPHYFGDTYGTKIKQ